MLLLLLSSVSGAPVSGSDSAARQEAIDSLVARSSLVELQISGSRTGLVYRVGVEGCLPLRQSGPPRTLYLVAWSLGHTILPPRIQLHPPIGREQFTRAAPLMRSMALAADAGAWRDGISATQKEGKVKARSDHLLDEAAWRTFPHAAKLLARWVDGALEPLPAGVQLLRAEGYPRGNLIDGPPVEYKDLVLLLDDVGVYSLLVGTVSRLLDRLTDRRSAVGEQSVYAVSAELKVEVLAALKAGVPLPSTDKIETNNNQRRQRVRAQSSAIAPATSLWTATTTLTSRCPAPRSSCATCKGRGFRRASTALSCASRTSRARSGGAWHRRPCGAPPP